MTTGIPSRATPADSQAPDRRSVLNWLLGAWGASVAGSVLYPILKYLIPPEIPEAATRSADGGKASTLAPTPGGSFHSDPRRPSSSAPRPGTTVRSRPRARTWRAPSSTALTCSTSGARVTTAITT